MYFSDYKANIIRKIDPSGKITTLAGDGTQGYKDGPLAMAEFNNPQGLAVDDSGKVYVADNANCYVRIIRPGPVRRAAQAELNRNASAAFPVAFVPVAPTVSKTLDPESAALAAAGTFGADFPDDTPQGRGQNQCQPQHVTLHVASHAI